MIFTLSRLEAQDDMQISTLRRVTEALGGELEIIAHLPGGDVRLKQAAGTSEGRSWTQRRRVETP